MNFNNNNNNSVGRNYPSTNNAVIMSNKVLNNDQISSPSPPSSSSSSKLADVISSKICIMPKHKKVVMHNVAYKKVSLHNNNTFDGTSSDKLIDETEMDIEDSNTISKPFTNSDYEVITPYVRPKVKDYLFIKTLNNSKCKIELILDIRTFQYYALKIFDTSRISSTTLFEVEKQVLTVLKNSQAKHVIKLYDDLKDENYIKSNKKHYFNGLIIEYAPYKDLFYHIQIKGKFEESICRTFFIQILKSIQSVHSCGYAHMDIKLENLLIDSDFSIKLADFDLSQSLFQKPKLEIKGGTIQYMPPEYFKDNIKDGEKVDIFSAGVVLFLLSFGHPPFYSSENTDKLYHMIITQNYTKFWSYHERNNNHKAFALKNFIIRMLDPEPKKRPTIQEALEDEWIKGIQAHIDTIKNEVLNRIGLKYNH